ncbi:MAG: HAD-IB family phosphatase [archaeon]
MAAKPITPKRDGIAFFDLDKTLRKGDLAEWFTYLHEAKLIDDAIWKSMLVEAGHLGKKGEPYLPIFATNIMKLYAKALEGKPATAIEQMASEFVRDPKLLRMHDFAEPLINLMNEHCITTLVTGQPIELARAIARKFGFSDYTGTELETRNGVYTGRVLINNSVFHQKWRSIRLLASKYRNFLKKSFAFGDSFEDRVMLSSVRVPVAVNPSHELEEYAGRRGWIVIRGKGNEIIQNVTSALRSHYLTKTRVPRQVRKARNVRRQRNVSRGRPRLR